MKRDFELIRLLLLDLEHAEPVDLAPFTDEQIKYHQALIIEAGLVEGAVAYPMMLATDIPQAVVIRRLTWDGHEFLDKVRSERVWARAKSLIISKGQTLSLEALKVALSEIIKNLIN